MDSFINWSKDFTGKAATQKIKQQGTARKLVTMTIDTPIDVTLDEAILKDGQAIGYISSGGYAHHVGQSMAMGYVDTQFSDDGAALEVEILGQMCSATVRATPLYDPDGLRMRV